MADMLPNFLMPKKTIYVNLPFNSAPTMPHELKIAIAQARNAKGWNQEQFAKMIQIPKADVNAWEAGKSVPPGAIIAKMEKVLGVKLPRPPKN